MRCAWLYLWEEQFKAILVILKIYHCMYIVLDFDYLQRRKMIGFGFQDLQIVITAQITMYSLNFPQIILETLKRRV